jgi:RNA polymerase II elongation factor ELL
LQTTSETNRHELYHSSGTGSDHPLDFTSLIKHTLVVQKAENVTASVDSALEQLKNSMAAVKEMKEANKYASLVSPRLPSSLMPCCRTVGLRL